MAAYVRPDEVLRGNETAAGRLSISRFGASTQSVITSPSVGPANAQRIIKNNPRRVRLIILNTSASGIYVSFDSKVSTTTGIYLPAFGGFLDSSAIDDGEEVMAEWWLLSDNGTVTVIVNETVTV